MAENKNVVNHGVLKKSVNPFGTIEHTIGVMSGPRRASGIFGRIEASRQVADCLRSSVSGG